MRQSFSISDAEFQRQELPAIPFLPQQYNFQSGLVVNVRSLRKDDDRMVLQLISASTDRGEGYALHEFPSLELLRHDLMNGYGCAFEELGTGKVVGCCGINACRRMRTNLAACSESELILDKAFQVNSKWSQFLQGFYPAPQKLTCGV